MTARLRVLPISTREEGHPTHYLVLDRLGELARELQPSSVQKLRDLAEEAGGIPLDFSFAVDIPEVDPQPEPAPMVSTVTVRIDPEEADQSVAGQVRKALQDHLRAVVHY